jgi:hypothetical protein
MGIGKIAFARATIIFHECRASLDEATAPVAQNSAPHPPRARTNKGKRSFQSFVSGFPTPYISAKISEAPAVDPHSPAQTMESSRLSASVKDQKHLESALERRGEPDKMKLITMLDALCGRLLHEHEGHHFSYIRCKEILLGIVNYENANDAFERH